MRALEELAGRPYFGRTWIIIEIAQARELDIICGGCKFEWSIFLHLCLQVHDIPHRHLLLYHGPVSREYYNGDSTPLITCFRQFEISACTDDRDRIFAMIGHPVVRFWNTNQYLKPDYQLSRKELLFVVLDWLEQCNARDHPLLVLDILLRTLRLDLQLPESGDFALYDFALYGELYRHAFYDWTLRSFDEAHFDCKTLVLTLSNGATIDCKRMYSAHWLDREVKSGRDLSKRPSRHLIRRLIRRILV